MREEEKKREGVSDEGGDMKDKGGGVREVRDEGSGSMENIMDPDPAK